MRHVDDGTIHAWLDGEIAEPGKTAWIDEHLRWCAACGARVAEERATREQAHALLGIASPVAEAPAFRDLVARAEKEARSRSERTADAGSLQRSRWFLQVGWAASVILAATIGWTAHELADRAPAETVALVPTLEERPVVSSANPSARMANTADTSNTATATTPQHALVEPAAAGRQAAMSSAAQQAEQQLAARLREQRARMAAAPAADGGVSFMPEQRLPVAATPARAEAAAGARAADSAPGLPAAAARPPADLGQSAAFASPQAPQEVSAPTLPAPLQESVSIARGTPVANTITVTIPGWQMVPRTEAAARSGMALYGIEGLEPVFTSISADRRAVRTVYRLESGGAVELEQHRAMPNGAATMASGAATITSLQPAASRGLTPAGRAGLAADAIVPARMWTDVRGGFRILLRTTSDATDLPALGAKLRVD